MEQKFIVTDQIKITAPAEKVWEVLTNPFYMRQWEEMPENFGDAHLQSGSIIEWEGFSRLTVTDFEPCKRLVLDVYLPKVELEPTAYDVSYLFELNEENGGTQLNLTIGDFAPLPNAQGYYDMSVTFAANVTQKVKSLAEAIV